MPLEWSERYNVHTMRVPHVGELVVAWHPTGYEIKVFNARLKNRPDDLGEAKALALSAARGMLADAAHTLETVQ
jgi:hypothetical protein